MNAQTQHQLAGSLPCAALAPLPSSGQTGASRQVLTRADPGSQGLEPQKEPRLPHRHPSAPGLDQPLPSVLHCASATASSYYYKNNKTTY